MNGGEENDLSTASEPTLNKILVQIIIKRTFVPRVLFKRLGQFLRIITTTKMFPNTTNLIPDKTNNSVLEFFVESAREKAQIKNLGDWLKSQGIDVHNPAWYSLFSWKREVADENATNEDLLKSRLTTELKNILPFLLMCNDDVNFIDKNGRTILHVYLANSESDYRHSQSNDKSKVFKIVKSLMESGASVNAVDKRGTTPLHIAAETDKLEILASMLDTFSNVDACDLHGNTVLHTVLERDSSEVDQRLDIVRILLGKGSDLNKKNEAGMTPLHLAICNYNIDMLQIFKGNGADFTVSTDNDETLLLLAYKHCNFKIPELVMLTIVNFLVDEGCKVNVQNKDGYSPVHYAVKWKTTLKRLIELGADVNYQTKIKRKTPLHLAVDLELWNCNTVPMLLQAGADMDAPDSQGRTPLHVALENENNCVIEHILEFSGRISDESVRSLMNMWLDSKSKLIIKKYVFMVTTIGFPVRGVFALYKRDEARWRKRCLREAKMLKTDKIDVETSIYQFLHMSWRRQLIYVDCLPKNLEKSYPWYGSVIRRARIEALRRRQLFEAAKMAWCQITEINFPDICVERILYFLNNWNLTVLIRAAQMSDSEKVQ